MQNKITVKFGSYLCTSESPLKNIYITQIIFAVIKSQIITSIMQRNPNKWSQYSAHLGKSDKWLNNRGGGSNQNKGGITTDHDI